MRREQFALEDVSISKEKNELQNVTLGICQGECYGIVCDSIEERNMMISLFEGDCDVAVGKIRFENKEIKYGGFAQLLHNEFTLIQNQSKLINSLSIMENICIFADASHLVKTERYHELTQEFLRHFEISLDVNRSVNQLTEKERVMVELLKAYAEHKKIIVLAEISGFLMNVDVEDIHQLISKMQHEGISFVLVETFGDLLFQWTSKILIIKNRIVFGCFNTEFLEKKKLYQFLSEGRKNNYHPPVEENSTEDEILQFQNITSQYLKDVSFHVASGEVLKIFCLDTQSIEGMRRIFWGSEDKYQGEMILDGVNVRIQNTRDMRKKRIGYCRETAYESMLMPDMSARDNVLMDLSLKVSGIWFFNKYKKSVDSYIEQWIGKSVFGKKLRDMPLMQRQQLAFAKLYLSAPRVLVCEKPFFNEDLHMKEVTLKMLESFRDRGIAVVILTTDFQDLSRLDGDVLYMKNGSLIDEDEMYQILYNV